MLGAAVRFVVSALMLMLIGYVVPGFSRLDFGQALLAALVIAIAGYILELAFGRVPYGRGFVGFVVSAVVIYLTQILVPGMHVTALGAVLAALVIGVVDMFVPTELRPGAPRPAR